MWADVGRGRNGGSSAGRAEDMDHVHKELDGRRKAAGVAMVTGELRKASHATRSQFMN